MIISADQPVDNYFEIMQYHTRSEFKFDQIKFKAEMIGVQKKESNPRQSIMPGMIHLDSRVKGKGGVVNVAKLQSLALTHSDN